MYIDFLSYVVYGVRDVWVSAWVVLIIYDVCVSAVIGLILNYCKYVCSLTRHY